ncbi:hypothetical protein AHAS_Ahas18G0129000 [Arachis hypogaea]
MYEKRHMWATAHIRGKFFEGFRTTSRCEVSCVDKVVEDCEDKYFQFKWHYLGVYNIESIGCLMDLCRQLSYVASRRQERFHLVRDTVLSLIEDFKIEDEQEKQVGAEADDLDGIFSKNPQNCRSKGRPSEKVKRKPQRCCICRMGYNKKSCPLAKDIQQTNVSCATSHGINGNPFEEGLDADAKMLLQRHNSKGGEEIPKPSPFLSTTITSSSGLRSPHRLRPRAQRVELYLSIRTISLVRNCECGENEVLKVLL